MTQSFDVVLSLASGGPWRLSKNGATMNRKYRNSKGNETEDAYVGSRQFKSETFYL